MPYQKTENAGYSTEENGFNYSLTWQIFQFFPWSIYYLWKDLLEDCVLKGATLRRLLWAHSFEHAKNSRAVLPQPALVMGNLWGLALCQPWLLYWRSRGWWCCRGATLISPGNRSQLHCTHDLFNAWHSEPGLKESCQLCSCLRDMASSVWQAWFWAQCHKEPWQCNPD